MTWRRTETIAIHVPVRRGATTDHLALHPPAPAVRQPGYPAPAVRQPGYPAPAVRQPLPMGSGMGAPPITWQASDGQTYVLHPLVAIPRTQRVAPARSRPVVVLAFLAAILVILLLLIGERRHPFSDEEQEEAVAAFSGAGEDAPSRGTFHPPGDGRLRGEPSVTPQMIDGILGAYGSPATGQGQVIYDLGVTWGIDPAWAVAFFIHESTAGTNPIWAGIKPGGATTHNPGNIICTAGFPRCHGRFRDYDSWGDGFADWYRLIAEEYLNGRGHVTIADVVPVYAPSVENDVAGYIGTVQSLVDTWRREAGFAAGDPPTAPLLDPLVPLGDPLRSERSVITQDYGVGTHAPAHIWGAVDLAIDGTGTGRADPDATQGHPIYATHAGMVTVTPNSWPAGNHVWITNEPYRTGYAHLHDVAVQSGQIVARGQKIGTVGSTGQSSGPHLDYQVWHMQNGQWVNLNPRDFID
mgnify:CR=1 FL=1